MIFNKYRAIITKVRSGPKIQVRYTYSLGIAAITDVSVELQLFVSGLAEKQK